MLLTGSSTKRAGARAHRSRICVALGLICAFAVLFPSRMALADTKQECNDAYQKTQILRQADKLEEAFKQAEACARDCKDDFRKDCTQWKEELKARLATIIVEVVDASGKPVTDALVSLDDVPWLDRLDGTAQIVSQGPHTLVVTVKDATPLKQAIVIREAEKNRKITISLPAKRPPPPPPPWPGHSIGPWILVGVGAGALIAGAVTGGIVVHDYGVMNDQCDEELGTCSQDGLDASSRGQVLGPVTTSLLVGGGSLVAGGIIWLVLAPKAEDDPSIDQGTTSFFIVPALSNHQMGAALGGSW